MYYCCSRQNNRLSKEFVNIMMTQAKLCLVRCAKNISDGNRTGRQVNVITPASSSKIHQLVLKWMMLNELRDIIKISQIHLSYIIDDKLERERFARIWYPSTRNNMFIIMALNLVNCIPNKIRFYKFFYFPSFLLLRDTT